MTRMKRRRFAVVVVFIFGMIFFIVTSLRYVPPTLFRTVAKTLRAPPAPPEEIFTGYVLNPIPESVTNIKTDQPGNFFGYEYTFRFNISREDLSSLIDSRPFIRIWNVKYKNGCIDWGWDRAGFMGTAKVGHSMPLYGDNWDLPREPVWFKPGLWENPEAYGFYKVGNLVNNQVLERDWQKLNGPVTIQVLLYNEKESEAYFIISSWDH